MERVMSEAEISNRNFAREGRSRSQIEEALVAGRQGDLDWRNPKNLQSVWNYPKTRYVRY